MVVLKTELNEDCTYYFRRTYFLHPLGYDLLYNTLFGIICTSRTHILYKGTLKYSDALIASNN